MKYLDEFRDRKIVENVARRIEKYSNPRKTYRFMEVCGTHTMSIFRYGLKRKLPKNIELISGPGCPVCVTEDSYIDKAVELGARSDVLIATFGDMLKVPGSFSSLELEKSKGADVRIVYSTIDALKLAENHPEKKVIFLGVGFETTAPTVAAAILEAKKRRLKNFFVLSGHKTMPRALEALVDGGVDLNGFILPAHVSAIIGSEPYKFLAERYRIPCVIAGFEPVDIMQAVLMLVGQVKMRNADIDIQYNRVVKNNGNLEAQKIIKKVFEKNDASWRGIGVISGSGLKIKKAFGEFDAAVVFKPKSKKAQKIPKACICGQILKGIKTPPRCKLFRKSCTPENPVGPCMVSSEGTCAAYYRYGDKHE